MLVEVLMMCGPVLPATLQQSNWPEVAEHAVPFLLACGDSRLPYLRRTY